MNTSVRVVCNYLSCLTHTLTLFLMENIPIGMDSNITTIAASNSEERRNMFAACEF